jgi:hypothetical protein
MPAGGLEEPHRCLAPPGAASPTIRARAVRALDRLRALPAERVVALLRDPAPGVVREATTALRRRTDAVPTDLAWQLQADPDRVELRRAGYRLLRVRGPVQRAAYVVLEGRRGLRAGNIDWMVRQALPGPPSSAFRRCPHSV